jgi:hypothetical protein
MLVLEILKRHHTKMRTLLGQLYGRSRNMKDVVVRALYLPLPRWNGHVVQVLHRPLPRWNGLVNCSYHYIAFAGLVMLLLALLKFCIGDFDVWPPNVLHALVCDKLYTASVRDYYDFCYGNGLPLRFATTLFSLCNDQCNNISSHTISTFDNRWHTDTSTLHYAMYYDVKFGQ